jgi:carbonic anhydrase/acetyltransferase-like protein (isoleucine patch superfamily)
MGRRNLYIVGAGGFGRECAGNFRLWNGFADRYDLKGFLDDDPAALAGYAGYPPIRGGVGDFRPGPDDVFVCALGIVAVRRRCIAALAAKGGRFATLAAPSAVVHATARLGEGCLVLDRAIVSADVKLGDHVLCHANVLLGHDTRVGDHAVNMMENAETKVREEVWFSDKAFAELEELAALVEKQLAHGLELFREQNNDPRVMQGVEKDEEAIDDMTEALRQHHVDRLKNKKCSAKNGMIYLDLLTNLERIGDHAENIATSVDRVQMSR